MFHVEPITEIQTHLSVTSRRRLLFCWSSKKWILWTVSFEV